MFQSLGMPRVPDGSEGEEVCVSLSLCSHHLLLYTQDEGDHAQDDGSDDDDLKPLKSVNDLDEDES